MGHLRPLVPSDGSNIHYTSAPTFPNDMLHLQCRKQNELEGWRPGTAQGTVQMKEPESKLAKCEPQRGRMVFELQKQTRGPLVGG